MSVTLKQISGFLDQLEFKHGLEDEKIITAFQLEDDHQLPMMITAPHDGSIFQIAAFKAIPTETISESEYKTQFMFYLLHAAWETSFCTPEMDKDGELRLLLEIPLADAEMTVRQLAFIIQGMLQFGNKVRSEGLEVLRTGTQPESNSRSSASSEAMAMSLVGQLLPSVEGRAKLRLLLQGTETPAPLRAAIEAVLPAMELLEAAADGPTSI